jgi:hypothetical protein
VRQAAHPSQPVAVAVPGRFCSKFGEVPGGGYKPREQRMNSVAPLFFGQQSHNSPKMTQIVTLRTKCDNRCGPKISAMRSRSNLTCCK